MGAMASQITSLTIVYSTVYSGADQRKLQSSVLLALCAGNSPVTGEFPAQRASNAENVSIWWRHHATDHNETWTVCVIFTVLYNTHELTRIMSLPNAILKKNVICKISAILSQPQCVNTLRPRQNSRNFAYDILNFIFSNENNGVDWIPLNVGPYGRSASVCEMTPLDHIGWQLPQYKNFPININSVDMNYHQIMFLFLQHLQPSVTRFYLMSGQIRL